MLASSSPSSLQWAFLSRGAKPRLAQSSVITWCGWTFHFDRATAHLSAEKLAKLRTQLAELRNSKKILRKKLESSLAPYVVHQHWPYLALLYTDWHSAKGTLQQIHPRLPLHARVINVGFIQVLIQQTFPKSLLLIRSQTRVALRSTCETSHRLASSCFAHDRVRTIRQKPTQLQCYAAADAMAKGEIFGIGGWIITSSQCAWFAEQYSMSEARTIWPALQDTAQRYIAFFETLAQLALAQLAHYAPLSTGLSPCPASDNAPTEAGLDKLWSNAEPLGSFLNMAAAWAAKHHVQFMVTRLAGEKRLGRCTVPQQVGAPPKQNARTASLCTL